MIPQLIDNFLFHAAAVVDIRVNLYSQQITRCARVEGVHRDPGRIWYHNGTRVLEEYIEMLSLLASMGMYDVEYMLIPESCFFCSYRIFEYSRLLDNSNNKS